MKKIFTLVMMSVLSVLVSARAFAAEQLRIDIDDPSRVQVFTDDPPTVPLEGLVAGVNNLDVAPGSYVRVQTKPGCLFTEVTLIDDYFEEETSYMNRVESSNGVQYVDIASRYPEDEWFRIRTSGATDTRTASCMVTVDDPSKIKLTRKSSDTEIALSAGVATIVKFDPNTEAELLLTPVDRKPYSVTVNDKEITSDTWAITIPVAHNDNVVIQTAFPDKDCAVKFDLTGNGAQDFITEVDVDGRPELNWKAPGFTVKAGQELSLKGNTTEYEVLTFTVGGHVEMFSNPFKFIVTEDVEIAIEVRKIASFEMTIDVDNPANVHIYRGYSYNGDEYTLTEGKNTVEVARNTPIISLVPAEGHFLKSVKIADYEYGIDELVKAPLMVGSLTDGDVLTVTTGTIVRDLTAMFYVELAENAHFRVLRADGSAVEIGEGFTSVPFYDRDNAFTIETGGSVEGLVYVNEEAVDMTYPGSYNFAPVLSDGDVVKVFYTGKPATHTVTFDVADGASDAFTVVRDRIRPVADITAGIKALNNSEFTIVPAGDAVIEVSLDGGEPLKAADNGAFTFTVTADTKVSVAKTGSGIEGIGVDEAADGPVFNLQGIRVADSIKEATDLPAGIYIHCGKTIRL